MNAHADLIQRFYAAFARKDAEEMVACYAPDVRFSDPVFPDLVGERAKGMWRMLVSRGKDLRLEFSGIEADERTGKAHWEAWYTFSATGRKVHNVIDATFTFRDGLIATHTDSFDLYRWSRMALGPKGTLLGWTPFVQRAIRRQADAALTRYLADRGPR
ncbi:MAG TPA: nuclear transport factor 2 family protein [Gemmatimonadales bacterium]|nr:nuclear transport factor 2 family protein [Gemmatimonadales bacterium]